MKPLPQPPDKCGRCGSNKMAVWRDYQHSQVVFVCLYCKYEWRFAEEVAPEQIPAWREGATMNRHARPVPPPMAPVVKARKRSAAAEEVFGGEE